MSQEVSLYSSPFLSDIIKQVDIPTFLCYSDMKQATSTDTLRSTIDMAELVWRGKYPTDQQQVSSISVCQSPQKHYQYITEHCYMPNNTPTSPPAFSTGRIQDPSLPSWYNRLIYG